MDHFFCNRELGIAYLRIPKCGCSSFEAWLASHHPAYGQNPGLTIHSDEANRTYFDDVAINPDPGIYPFRFTFVREPIARFRSFYRDKILATSGNAAFLERTADLGLKRGMGMLECLELISQLPAERMNPHFAPQSMFLLDGARLRVDFIGRFERFDRDVNRLQTLAGSRIPFPHRNPGRPSVELPDLRSKELQLLHSIYATDFQLLGYDAPC